MKTLSSIYSIIFLFSLLITNLSSANTPKIVAITQIVAHPTLDKVRQGIIQGLKQENFIDKQNIIIDYQNANGNITLAAQIAKKFISQDSNVIIAITTPSAQTVASAAKNTNIPIVFATVTDPIKAKLVSSLQHPTGNITGTSNPSAIKQQLKMIKQFLPKIKTLGLVINFSEINSVELLAQVQNEAKILGIKVKVAAAVNSSEVSSAGKSLVGKAQAILLLQDNTIASALPSLMKTMQKNKIPVFASFIEAVEQGAVAALAYDEYQIGVQTGIIAAKILNGKKPNDIPVEAPQKLSFIVNEKIAASLDIKIPKEISSIILAK
jgi:putative tryptophan/tyrosine transport system substrate-binding protein